LFSCRCSGWTGTLCLSKYINRIICGNDLICKSLRWWWSHLQWHMWHRSSESRPTFLSGTILNSNLVSSAVVSCRQTQRQERMPVWPDRAVAQPHFNKPMILDKTKQIRYENV
jgi:hypothetical protein